MVFDDFYLFIAYSHIRCTHILGSEERIFIYSRQADKRINGRPDNYLHDKTGCVIPSSSYVWQDIIQGKADEIQRHFSESIYERNRINLFVLIVILRLPSY